MFNPSVTGFGTGEASQSVFWDSPVNVDLEGLSLVSTA